MNANLAEEVAAGLTELLGGELTFFIQARKEEPPVILRHQTLIGISVWRSEEGVGFCVVDERGPVFGSWLRINPTACSFSVWGAVVPDNHPGSWFCWMTWMAQDPPSQEMRLEFKRLADLVNQ